MALMDFELNIKQALDRVRRGVQSLDDAEKELKSTFAAYKETVSDDMERWFKSPAIAGFDISDGDGGIDWDENAIRAAARAASWAKSEASHRLMGKLFTYAAQQARQGNG